MLYILLLKIDAMLYILLDSEICFNFFSAVLAFLIDLVADAKGLTFASLAADRGTLLGNQLSELFVPNRNILFWIVDPISSEFLIAPSSSCGRNLCNFTIVHMFYLISIN